MMMEEGLREGEKENERDRARDGMVGTGDDGRAHRMCLRAGDCSSCFLCFCLRCMFVMQKEIFFPAVSLSLLN
jgi:hypothetical protein